MGALIIGRMVLCSHQSDVNGLTNDGMYPFVCSHACLTNQFTESECFGETWLRAPNKGGLAFWGASTYSYWDEDDILEKSMFKVLVGRQHRDHRWHDQHGFVLSLSTLWWWWNEQILF